MKLKKMTIILMIILFMTIHFITGISSNVQAATLPVEKADLYSKGEVVLFNYDGIGIGVEVIVYQKDGKEYPAYCINKGRPGVTPDHGYTVDIHQLLTNNKIWKAIINGYPFKTPEQLGCNTMQEAYAATKMAVYDAMYNYDLSKFTIHNDNDANRRVVNAINQIILAARRTVENKIQATIQIQDETKEWKVDEIDNNYVSKTYSVSASAANKTYEISLKGEQEDIQITDLKNKEKNDFDKAEKFKVLVPIHKMEQAGEFTIHATSALETMPILYGESPDPTWQNFAITAGTFEVTDVDLKQTYQKNLTKISIQKEDGDTQVPIKNATFQLLDEKQKVLFTDLTTNEKGEINLENIVPGNYYLKETKPAEGYTGYHELIPVEIKLHEQVTIHVKNYQDITKEEEIETTQKTIEAGKKLPRTGC